MQAFCLRGTGWFTAGQLHTMLVQGGVASFKLGPEVYRLKILGQTQHRATVAKPKSLFLPPSLGFSWSPSPSLWPRPLVSQCLQRMNQPFPAPKQYLGRKSRCPQNQRTFSALFLKISNAARREAGDLLCKVVKKKKAYETQNPGNRRRAACAGWHMHHGVAILPGAVGSKLGWHLRYCCYTARHTAWEGS